jgi:acetyltransferase-like isoleucine patch superfamily enzyme
MAATIAWPAVRDAIFRLRAAAAVRPRAFAAFGEGTLVHPPLSVTDRSRVEIGARTFLLGGAQLRVGKRGRVRIGSRVYLGRDLTILCEGLVEIGDDVMASDRVVLADTAPDPRDPSLPVGAQPPAPPRPVRIGDGVFLGMGAIVLPGVEVGPRALIGAGSVVAESVPGACMAAGNPARVVRHFDAARGAWREGPPR